MRFPAITNLGMRGEGNEMNGGENLGIFPDDLLLQFCDYKDLKREVEALQNVDVAPVK